MAHLWAPLKYFWASVFIACLLGVGVNALWQPLPADAQANILANAVWIALGLAGLLSLTGIAWWADRGRRLREAFALLTPATELKPEAVGLTTAKVGDEIRGTERPYYQEDYQPRMAVRHEAAGASSPDRRYTEEDLREELRKGQGFILMGQPLEGKTRTLYEVVRGLGDVVVVQPHKEPYKTDGPFALLAGKDVVILLNELSDFGGYDLKDFQTRIEKQARTVAIAGSCRDGADLTPIRQLGSPLQRFYDEVPLKLSLEVPQVEAKQALFSQLTGGLGGFDPDVPTLGMIVLKGRLNDMETRWRELGYDPRGIMQAILLLQTGGVSPFTYQRVKGVLKRPAELGFGFDAHDRFNQGVAVLIDNHFLRASVGGEHDVAEPEPMYLSRVVTYVRGRSPTDDLSLLNDILISVNDAEGLSSLGHTVMALGRYAAAVDAFDHALRLGLRRPSGADIGRRQALVGLGRNAEALDGYDHPLKQPISRQLPRKNRVVDNPMDFDGLYELPQESRADAYYDWQLEHTDKGAYHSALVKKSRGDVLGAVSDLRRIGRTPLNYALLHAEPWTALQGVPEFDALVIEMRPFNLSI